jgi:hypothetical protein
MSMTAITLDMSQVAHRWLALAVLRVTSSPHTFDPFHCSTRHDNPR